MSASGNFAAMNPADGLLRRRAFRVLVLAILLSAPAGGTFSQQSPGMSSQFPSSPRGVIPPQDSNQASSLNDQYGNSVEVEKRLRMINVERQKSMVADTDKLLKLAQELNDEIAKINSGDLSPAQLRKVAEIEKLAHNVRDKMVMSVRGPQFNGPQLNLDAPSPYFASPTH